MTYDFHQFYLGCLAHASYLIASNGEAAVVDPQRDVDQYIDEADRRGVTIRYVIETHLHADFVSGHRELAARTGAEIVFGAAAGAEFRHRAVRDGDVLELGGIELRAIETPGHTPESVSWLVAGEKLLTGDTLFIGDVGRPDLAGGRGYTPAMMAAALYDSLHEKILALPDDVEVWPAHGAGSACGKNISKERSSTIGIQRRTNWALRPMPKDEFVRLMTDDLAAPPPYFARDAEINRRGARPLGDIAANALDANAVRALMNDGAIVLDVRDVEAFGAGHIRGAINIGLGGQHATQFAGWAGTLLPFDARIVIVADTSARAEEAVMRLARVGMENVIGCFAGEWPHEREALTQISVAELRNGGYRVLDVRRPGEYESGHVPGATNVPLHELQQHFDDIDDGPLAVICAGGYRSSAAASLLARAGRRDLFNVTGGTSAWLQAGLPVEAGAPAPAPRENQPSHASA
ncbi:MAG TPA: MBL fold metallo-hydrolase [Thermoanaerobaculia bacterium]|nr:MBL fold metallo-hydrolase [Thermoanaerobaculia bacterium]